MPIASAIADLIGMLVVLGGGGAMASGAVALHLRRIARMSPDLRAPWDATAGRLGLSLQDKSGWNHRAYTLSGTRSARSVRAGFSIRGKNAWPSWRQKMAAEAGLPGPADDPFHSGHTTIGVPVRAALPRQLAVYRETAAGETARYLGLQDLRIGDPALDSALRIASGEPAATYALGQHPATRRALRVIASQEGMQLQDGWVKTRVPGEAADRVAALLNQAVAVAEALEEACNDALCQVAARRGLAVEDRPIGPRAEGSVDGVNVQLETATDGVLVRAALPDTAPQGLNISALEPAAPTGTRVQLANPILARAIHVYADQPADAAARFDDDATEAVLAVVRGLDGAYVADGRVVAPLANLPDADTIEAAVYEAVRLARTLR